MLSPTAFTQAKPAAFRALIKWRINTGYQAASGTITQASESVPGGATQTTPNKEKEEL